MSNKYNPFEEMQSRQISTFFQGEADRKIKARLDSNMGAFRLLGNIADVYLNRFVDTMVGMANGAEISDEEVEPDQQRLPQNRRNRKDNKYPNL